MNFFGNNAPTPGCAHDRATNLYALNTVCTTNNASSLFWLVTPPTGTYMIGFNLDVDMDGGTHCGTPVSLCGTSSDSYPLSLGGGAYTVTMDVVVTGLTYTIDFR